MLPPRPREMRESRDCDDHRGARRHRRAREPHAAAVFETPKVRLGDNAPRLGDNVPPLRLQRRQLQARGALCALAAAAYWRRRGGGLLGSTRRRLSLERNVHDRVALFVVLLVPHRRRLLRKARRPKYICVHVPSLLCATRPSGHQRPRRRAPHRRRRRLAPFDPPLASLRLEGPGALAQVHRHARRVPRRFARRRLSRSRRRGHPAPAPAGGHRSRCGTRSLGPAFTGWRLQKLALHHELRHAHCTTPSPPRPLRTGL
mmetsp:Transcript_29873/g.100628  ORF Transcript_29873/g.100628 Transcript_29873/m.100628 type:complete len:259 (+) Transcript_29873:3111-3887(+)